MLLKIGQVSDKLGVSVDTLRYYEKIGLISGIERTDTGIRLYSVKNIATLKFVKRAQRMHFSLDEIKSLIRLRDEPETTKPRVRALAKAKLEEIETQIQELQSLRDELSELSTLCLASRGDCPILDRLDSK